MISLCIYEIDADDAVGKEVFLTPTTTNAEDYPITDYLIPEDEVLDLISGEDSDHGDGNPHNKSLEEVNDILGVRLSENTARSLNAAIDKVMINNTDQDTMPHRTRILCHIKWHIY